MDFSSVALAAVAQGFDIAGYSAQAQFLVSGGLDEELEYIASLPVEERVQLSQEIKTLTLPGEMGERFKCIALRKGSIVTPTAFEIADRAHTL